MLARQLLFVSMLWVAVPIGGASAGMPEPFTLGRFIPDDVWLYVHTIQTPETTWIDEQWARVWRAFEKSEIADDLTGLVLSQVAAEDRAEVDAQIRSCKGLVLGVNWGEVFGGKEFAFAERASSTARGYDYFLLSRTTPESAEANYQALVRIISRIGEVSSRVRVSTQDVQGVPTRVLYLSGGEMGATGLRLTVFRKNDVLAIVTGKQSVRDVIRRLDENSTARGIANLPRFQNALAQVPPPGNQVTYVDLQMLMRDILAQMSGEKSPRPFGPTPQIMTELGRIGQQFDIADYSISSSRIENQRQFTETYGRFQKGKENLPFARVLTDRQAFEPFDRFIPSKATAFSLSSFINLEHLYHAILDHLSNDTAEGPGLLQKWNALLTQLGFDPQRDLFDWWGGEFISVSLPAAMITPMARKDFVLMVRVKDSALAAQKVNALLDTVSARFKGQGQMLLLQPAKVRVEGFRQITHPMLAMLIQPVIGVHDGWLMVASSPAALNQCLAVAAGEAPSIRKNERFAAEGIIPEGAVSSASFGNTSRRGEELADALGMVGFVAGLLPMIKVNANDGEDSEAMGLLQKLLPLVAKLGPILREIDFYSSESAVSTFDGSAWRDRQVTVYKDRSTLEETRLARRKSMPN